MTNQLLINGKINLKFGFVLTLFLALFLVPVTYAEEIVKWEFTGNSTPSPDNGASATTVGIETTTPITNSWIAKNWTTGIERDENKYFQFHVDLTGYSAINLTFRDKRTTSGPQKSASGPVAR